MSQMLRIGPFLAVMTAAGGNARPNMAGAMLNVRVGDGWVRPRYGYRNLAAAPAGFAGAYGFERLVGYTDAYLKVTEWVSIEKRGAAVAPYSVDPATWARTEILNGAAHAGLSEVGDWAAFCFDADSYWINPSVVPSLYRHRVGDDASWEALQDAAYVALPDDPTLSVTNLQRLDRLFTGSDTIAVSGAGVSTPTSLTSTAGQITVSGNAGNNTQTTAPSVVTVTFATPLDLTKQDYIAMVADGEVVFIRFKTGVLLEINRTVGGWITPEQKPYLNSGRTQTGAVALVKGVSGIDSVTQVRFTLKAEPQPNSTGKAYTVWPFIMGGTYVHSAGALERVWDATYRSADTSYGVRYRNVATSAVSGIKAKTLDSSVFGGRLAGNSDGALPVGDRVEIESGPLLTGGFTDDPTGASFVIDFLRLDQTGVWRVLGSKPNTTGQSWKDVKGEYELSALTVAPPGTYVPPEPKPVFSTGQLINGFATKGGVVWLYDQGKANIRYSTVGNALSLFDKNIAYDVDDLTRPADFTMSDNFADAPLGGVQAGSAIIILGREGAYGQTGDRPSEMTPPRKLPGSMGGVGRFAFARFRDAQGNHGMAWLDASGENVWFASAGLVYSTDTQARPVELSAPIRGSVRTFLYDEQRETIPGIALANAQMEVDEATGSLWIVLGQRALVLRPQSVIDGTPQWEFYQYLLGASSGGGGGTVSVTSDPFGATTGTQEARAGGTVNWTSPGNVIAGTGVATAPGIDPGEKTHWLRADSMLHVTPLPAEGTLTGLTLRVRHRDSAVDGGGAKLASLEVYRGATLKQSLVGAVVPMTMTDVDFVLDASNFDIASINAASLSARLGYDSVGTAFNPADWTVAWSPTGNRHYQAPNSVSQTQTFTVTATYHGSGTPPPYVPLSITGYARGTGGGNGGGPTNYGGNASVDNGLGQADSGAILAPTPDPPPPERYAGGTGLKVAPVVGGVATATVVMTASVAVTAPTAPQDAKADFQITAATVVVPGPSAVEVESVLLIASYTVPGSSGERSIIHLAYGPDRNLLWLRSSGQIDAAEWCPSCLAYVQGSNRDGGLPMPEGYWETARLNGMARRLARVECERDSFEAIDFVAYNERVPLGVAANAPTRQRWARFGTGLTGTAHRVRIRVPETLEGVAALDLMFVATTGRDR